MEKWNKTETSSNWKLQRILLYHQGVDYRLSTVHLKKIKTRILMKHLNDGHRFEY